MGLGHIGDVPRHHLRIAAKAVARQDQRAAADVLGLAVGAQKTRADNATLLSGEEVGDLRRGHHIDTARRDRLQQGRQQLGPVQSGSRVHVRLRVAGIAEGLVRRQRHAVRPHQPLDGPGGFAGDAPRHRGIGPALRLDQQVALEDLRCIVDAGLSLQPGPGGRNLPARERGAAAGRGVAFQDQRSCAAFMGRQRRAAAAGAGPDHHDRNAHLEGFGEFANDAQVSVLYR
jgi:hypothetical protein